MDDREPDSNAPCSIDELWTKFQVIPGFARLAIACGCPTAGGGGLVPAVFFNWMPENYRQVRVAAGLPALAETTSSDPMDLARCKARNTLLTFADYAESRSTDPVMKEAWRDVRDVIT